MKRKSKSFITGGLLGLAGLSLLPQGAEAATNLPTGAQPPSGGAALAANPAPVIASEPSALATAPQVEAQPPAWSPAGEQSAAIAAAATPPTLVPSPLELGSETEAEVARAVPEPAPEPAATPAPEPATGPGVAAEAAALAPGGEPLPEILPPPAAAQPRQPPAELTQPLATPAIAASPRLETAPPALEPAVAIAPSPALTAPARLPRASPPPDLATLRARGAAVQALMQDLRAAAGLPEYAPGADLRAAPPRQNAQSGLGSGPQLWPQRPLQRPQVSARATDVALALAVAQPVMSPAPTETMAPPARASLEPILAQTPSAADAAQIRDDLQVAPLTNTATPRQTFPPSPNAGIPSGFGANWGDLFISASLSGADRLRPEADGSLSAGFGLGDSRRAVGVELSYNLLSMRRFGENGGFDAKIHRQVYSSDRTEVAAAVGLNNFASYGPEAGGSRSSLYGVVTAAHLLQPDHRVNRMPITGTLGLGGGSFSGEGSDIGVIAGVGLQVHPQFSVNTAWSGVGVNIGASIVPVPTLPLTLNLLYGDIGNNTPAGSVAVLSVGYGFNFGPRF